MFSRMITKPAFLLLFLLSSSVLWANEEESTEKSEPIPEPTSFVNEPSRTALLEDTRVFIQQQTNN